MPVNNYTLPNFNLLADFWTAGHKPSADPPDVTGVPCQLYMHSKGLLDITPGSPLVWVPPLYCRVPMDVYLPVVGDILHEDHYPGTYYLVRYVQRIHIGFPNEYIAAIVEHCKPDGTVTI